MPMTDGFSAGTPTGVLERDAMRRVWARSVRVTFSGVVGATAVLSLAVWVRLLSTNLRSIDAPSIFEAALPFSRTIDPVLPTLITALLALAVVKASRFAPGFIVGTAVLCGFLASTWGLLGLLALFAPAATEGAEADNAVAGVGLGVVAVAVTVVLTEVLPLSKELRDRQLQERLARNKTLASRASSRARRVSVRFSAGTHGAREARLIIIGWYLATAVVVLVPIVLAYSGVWGEPTWITEVWVTGALIGAPMLTGLIALHVGLRYPLELEGWRDDRMIFACISVVFAIGAGVMTVLFASLLAQFGGPYALLGYLSAGWYAVLFLSAVLPVTFPLPKWGWFGQVVVCQRVVALEGKSDRLEEVQRAAAMEAASEAAVVLAEPTRPTRWWRRLLRLNA